MTYLSVAELTLRDEDALPRNEDNTVNTGAVQAALDDASGIVRIYLPELVGGGSKHLKPPARLEDALKPITRDLAIYYLTRNNGEEDARRRYDSAIRTLKALSGSDDDGTAIGSDTAAEIVAGKSGFLHGR